MKFPLYLAGTLLALAPLGPLWAAAAPASAPNAADQMFAEYFRTETAKLAAGSLGGVKTLRDWTDHRAEYREQLFEMLGLSPRPAKTDLRATVTGRVEHAEFFVEKLHFQSLPGLYVTANLYVPKNLTGRAPAILYGSGHAVVKDGKTSLGNKAGYQHHGEWFARHGYICLTLDTIQLGELEGAHHGTKRLGMWWWNSRGYTPAGVEAWNGIRALDYLQSRADVDPEKIGMTGRSGGGAYTWYTAALDDRIKVAVPVAGITDLHNHVVDGVVKGHCDCMFMVNTYRWDYTKLAALLAPRPLLLANSDKDGIFPLDGVVRVHGELARLYALHKASDKLGLLITEGPHKDTQDLQVPAFRWFNRWLKNEPDTLVKVAAEKLFDPKQLRVFPVGGEPKDERTTKIHDTFVPLAAPAVPANAAEWAKQKETWMRALREKVFRGWPAEGEPLAVSRLRSDIAHAARVTEYGFTTHGDVRLSLTLHTSPSPEQSSPKKLILVVHDSREYHQPDVASSEAFWSGDVAVAYFSPRGFDLTTSGLSAVDQIEVRRRYMLLGQTIDSMRVWDIRRAVAALRTKDLLGDIPVQIVGYREQATNALYASLFIDNIENIRLVQAPTSHTNGPDYLNVLRILDIPQALALAAERQPVKLTGSDPDKWSWPTQTAQRLGWPRDRLSW
ncbi:MAG: prolyl oligopeptidase family serine peptidase [Opitutaceae bacterium]|nr:prolyl oligopeptidase family serine peptidase [Opitutaceae bacterium]